LSDDERLVYKDRVFKVGEKVRSAFSDRTGTIVSVWSYEDGRIEYAIEYHNEYNDHVWVEPKDVIPFVFEPVRLPPTYLVCECGSTFVDGFKHSDYCPMYKRD
jgi:hypothetical protein